PFVVVTIGLSSTSSAGFAHAILTGGRQEGACRQACDDRRRGAKPPSGDVMREPPPPKPVTVGVPRPVDEERLPLDLFALDEAPVAAVLGVVTVVAHHEIRVRRDDGGLAAVRVPAVGLPRRRQRPLAAFDVRLAERLAVDEHLRAAYLHAVSGRADDPLDEVALLVLRILEDD